ncbi:MAG: hypothetical protein IKF90_15695 [Parasporobacterium sp.]|nr:hypothetical protein [Parasporobacterium sp.]
MSRIKAFFKKLSEHRASTYCSCGHSFSANLPFCPFCGRRNVNHEEIPVD